MVMLVLINHQLFNIYILTVKPSRVPSVLTSRHEVSVLLFQDGQTALHQAAQAGHHDTVAALILGGCDVGIQDFVSFYLQQQYCCLLRTGL